MRLPIYLFTFILPSDWCVSGRCSSTCRRTKRDVSPGAPHLFPDFPGFIPFRVSRSSSSSRKPAPATPSSSSSRSLLPRFFLSSRLFRFHFLRFFIPLSSVSPSGVSSLLRTRRSLARSPSRPLNNCELPATLLFLLPVPATLDKGLFEQPFVLPVSSPSAPHEMTGSPRSRLSSLFWPEGDERTSLPSSLFGPEREERIPLLYSLFRPEREARTSLLFPASESSSPGSSSRRSLCLPPSHRALWIYLQSADPPPVAHASDETGLSRSCRTPVHPVRAHPLCLGFNGIYKHHSASVGPRARKILPSC